MIYQEADCIPWMVFWKRPTCVILLRGIWAAYIWQQISIIGCMNVVHVWNYRVNKTVVYCAYRCVNLQYFEKSSFLHVFPRLSVTCKVSYVVLYFHLKIGFPDRDMTSMLICSTFCMFWVNVLSLCPFSRWKRYGNFKCHINLMGNV